MSHASLETKWVFVIVVKERSKEFIRVKVEFFNKVGVRYVSCLIQFSFGESDFATFGEQYVTRGWIDAISKFIDWQATPIFAEFLSCFLAYRHNEISLVVSVQIASNVYFVEVYQPIVHVSLSRLKLFS